MRKCYLDQNERSHLLIHLGVTSPSSAHLILTSYHYDLTSPNQSPEVNEYQASPLNTANPDEFEQTSYPIPMSDLYFLDQNIVVIDRGALFRIRGNNKPLHHCIRFICCSFSGHFRYS